MGQSDMQTSENSVKAAHRYEVLDAASKAPVAGKRFHFIGAGGVGMSGLAKLLVRNHGIVTGSDEMASNVIERLRRIGADIKIGHFAENLDEQIETVVISAAIKEDNPELKLARQRGLKIYKYAEMLGIVCNRYEGIAVSGTHGKSTTSGWLVYLLKKAGLDPNFIVGADITQLGGSSGVGESGYFVAEACEYDRSFLNLKPRIGAILNIEQDHLDYYEDEDAIVEAFSEFASGVKPGGLVIVNGQDANAAKAIDRLPGEVRCENFGFG